MKKAIIYNESKPWTPSINKKFVELFEKLRVIRQEHKITLFVSPSNIEESRKKYLLQFETVKK